MDTSIVRKLSQFARNQAFTFVDPATGEQLAIGVPPVKEADTPVSKGTGMTAAKPAQLDALAAKFAK